MQLGSTGEVEETGKGNRCLLDKQMQGMPCPMSRESLWIESTVIFPSTLVWDENYRSAAGCIAHESPVSGRYRYKNHGRIV